VAAAYLCLVRCCENSSAGVFAGRERRHNLASSYRQTARPKVASACLDHIPRQTEAFHIGHRYSVPNRYLSLGHVMADRFLIVTRTSNHALELTSARSMFTFSMTTSFSTRLTLALGGRSSALSR